MAGIPWLLGGKLPSARLGGLMDDRLSEQLEQILEQAEAKDKLPEVVLEGEFSELAIWGAETKDKPLPERLVPAPAPPLAVAVGPSTGKVNEPLTFSTSITGSPEYRFDWGDGTYSDWSPSPSAAHSWSSHGSYVVRIQGRERGIPSMWSPGTVVTIEPQG